uniref:Reverse transcriptase domain-containing protein n=1 Tax=viral metagenome TaxID=1070528 RepID=A0A6C0ITM6_9ZZZZ
MESAYYSKLFNPLITYKGTDDQMIAYLSYLWKDNTSTRTPIGDANFVNHKQNINVTQFKAIMNKISDNIVFRGNFGAYGEALEKELSLNKKSIIMNYKQSKELYLCLDDLIKYNRIRPELFEKIKYATIFIKHKKGDEKDPKNFRFLSNHHKIFKILDKFWTNSLINILKKNKGLPDRVIVRNNLDREYSVSIKDLALEKLTRFKLGKKIVLLDIQKAFDSVSWNALEKLLLRNITRKVNKQFAEKIVKQYMFLNTERCIKFNSKSIKFNKSIATGLPSSTLVFSLIIEQIIFEWTTKEKCNDELLVNTFVDDMYLEFSDITRCDYLVRSLINYLKDNDFIINESKTKTNIEELQYSKIDCSDCYLGLPFANNDRRYVEECVIMFKNRYYDISIKNMINILESDKDKNIKVRRQILGFFNYKLHGLKLFGRNNLDVLDTLKEYINIIIN